MDWKPFSRELVRQSFNASPIKKEGMVKNGPQDGGGRRAAAAAIPSC